MLNVGPVGTAMVIPGCNEGNNARGGPTSLSPCRDDDDNDCW